jgi:Leucine-rich repeat (LRR) protein
MKKHYFSLLFLFFFSVASAQIVNIPDPVFKALLLSASPTNQIASYEIPNNYNQVSQYSTIDTNNDGEIQLSEILLVKYLNISSSNVTSMEGINSFINLKYLDCTFNSQLLELNLNGLYNLERLYCYTNSSLTSLNVSGLSNLIRLVCTDNQLNLLNVDGLNNLQFFHCYNNQLTNLDVSDLTSLEILHCSGNLLSNLDLTNLTNLQIVYCSDNQLTTLTLTGLNSLEGLFCGLNNLVGLNLSSLTSLEYFDCQYNQITSLDVSDLTNLIQLNCSFNQLSTLNVSGLINLSTLECSYNSLSSLILSGITNPIYNTIFGLNFSVNPNLVYICADEEDITFVQSKIDEFGYTSTCQVNSYCSFTPGGTFYTIQGNNKFDGNSNGCDVTDGFYPNLRFSITDGTNSGSLISNASGNYSNPVSAGTHTITPQLENPSYFTVSPTNVTVTFPATASPFVQDFCIVPNGVHHDLEVVIIPLEPARPGFDATYKIKYKNKGTVSETATLVFDFNDDVLDYVSATLAPTSTGIGLLSWNIGTVIPFQSGEFVVTLNVNSPMETPAVNAGDILSYTATINGLNTDETQLDNTFPLRQIVVNSFDPNDKTCLEGTTINPTMIGEYVHYQIRFENTGTFPAQNVVVKDMIDTTKFDISTLQISDTSHSCVTRITNPNKVEFIFENINLPFDDATNDGYVVFKIKTNSTLVVGNTISNLANIYFDYNFPIVTNIATSTFQALANSTFNLDNYISLSPNPAKDVLNINVQNEVNIKSIAIYNMLGQLVQITTSPTNSINVSDLKAGNYVIKLHIEKGEIIRKFIKK